MRGGSGLMKMWWSHIWLYHGVTAEKMVRYDFKKKNKNYIVIYP